MKKSFLILHISLALVLLIVSAILTWQVGNAKWAVLLPTTYLVWTLLQMLFNQGKALEPKMRTTHICIEYAFLILSILAIVLSYL